MPGMRPRQELVDQIEKLGGVVQMPDGRTIHRVEDLPSEAEIALKSGSLGAVALARSELERRKAEIDHQLQTLETTAVAENAGDAAKPDDKDKPEPPKALSQPPAKKGA